MTGRTLSGFGTSETTRTPCSIIRCMLFVKISKVRSGPHLRTALVVSTRLPASFGISRPFRISPWASVKIFAVTGRETCGLRVGIGACFAMRRKPARYSTFPVIPPTARETFVPYPMAWSKTRSSLVSGCRRFHGIRYFDTVRRQFTTYRKNPKKLSIFTPNDVSDLSH